MHHLDTLHGLVVGVDHAAAQDEHGPAAQGDAHQGGACGDLALVRRRGRADADLERGAHPDRHPGG